MRRRHFITLVLAGVAMVLGGAGAVHADLGDQLFKLFADDGAENDLFGFSVGISGAIAIAGARADDDNGPRSGSAYLFDVTDPSNPVQIAKLLADDGAVDDGFGFSVAISGATAIVGALGENGDWAGAAYMFDISDPANPVQIAKVLPEDGAALDFFGACVALSGATAVVGAWGKDDNGDLTGSAYLFDITTGDQLFKLLADDGDFYDEFGFTVAISGNTAIVGAPDPFAGTGSGMAYLFDITTGRQIAKLLPDDEDSLTLAFGTSVGISGGAGNETAIVGVEEDDELDERAGAAYLFDAGTAPGKCPWDLDDSGDVGTGDLILLLGSWGDPYGTPALIELLGNWGPCPK